MTEPRRPRAKPRLSRRLLLLSVSVLLSLLAGEIAVRGIGDTGPDGQFLFRGSPVRPFRLPVETTRETLDEWRERGDSRVVWHPLLGWAPRAGATAGDGLYRYDRRGVRGDVELADAPPPGVTRIALFGDSFMHGDDLGNEETIAARLEARARAAGLRIEVANLAFSGYGMDQALLRWRIDGRPLRPHVVLLGFQAENLARNLNLVRALYSPRTGMPFTKPRFVLDEGRLRLVNSPVVPAEEIADTIRDIERWDLVGHERFYASADYERPFWRASRLLGVVADRLVSPSEYARRLAAVYDPEGEAARLGLAIADAFAEEVVAAGAEFAIVHLPRRGTLSRHLDGDPPEYAEILAALAARHPVVRTLPALARLVGDGSTDAAFHPWSHYSAAANDAVAGAIFESLSPAFK